VTHPYLDGAGRPRVLAHRGLVDAAGVAAGIAENSFAALAAAHAVGAEFIESDCHLTRDGQVVLFHDADLRRVTGDPRAVSEVDLAELEQIMASRGGAVTLEQALRAFPDTRFNIDVKADAAAEPAGRIIAPHAERVLVTSFSDRRRRVALAAARAVRPELVPATSPGSGTVARLIGAVHVPRLAGRVLRGVDAVQIPRRQGPVRVLTHRLLDAAHAAGIEVHVWTVNDPEEMAELIAMGVDGVVTDRADAAIARLRPTD